MTAAEKRDERADAIARLRELVKPGDTVYTILRHVSRSGMMRTIDAAVITTRTEFDVERPSVFCIGWAIAKALDMRFDHERGGVKVSGAGMDMGFHLVYNLGRTLWPDGVPCSGENCQSNDHSNGLREMCVNCAGSGYVNATTGQPAVIDPDDGDDAYTNTEKCDECRGFGQTRKSYPRGAGVMHKDGGYALQARWL